MHLASDTAAAPAYAYVHAESVMGRHPLCRILLCGPLWSELRRDFLRIMEKKGLIGKGVGAKGAWWMAQNSWSVISGNTVSSFSYARCNMISCKMYVTEPIQSSGSRDNKVLAVLALGRSRSCTIANIQVRVLYDHLLLSSTRHCISSAFRGLLSSISEPIGPLSRSLCCITHPHPSSHPCHPICPRSRR